MNVGGGLPIGPVPINGAAGGGKSFLLHDFSNYPGKNENDDEKKTIKN